MLQWARERSNARALCVFAIPQVKSIYPKSDLDNDTTHMRRMSQMQEQKRVSDHEKQFCLHREDVTSLWNVVQRVRIPVGLSSVTATLRPACLIAVRDPLCQPPVYVNGPVETPANHAGSGSRHASGAVSPRRMERASKFRAHSARNTFCLFFSFLLRNIFMFVACGIISAARECTLGMTALVDFDHCAAPQFL